MEASSSKPVVSANIVYGDERPLKYMDPTSLDDNVDKTVRTSIVISRSWSTIDNHSSTVSNLIYDKEDCKV